MATISRIGIVIRVQLLAFGHYNPHQTRAVTSSGFPSMGRHVVSRDSSVRKLSLHSETTVSVSGSGNECRPPQIRPVSILSQ